MERNNPPGLETVSPPISDAPQTSSSSPSAAARPEADLAAFAAALGEELEERFGRLSAARKNVGHIHPHQFASHRLDRIAAKEMHAFNDGIRGDDNAVSGERQLGRIVREIGRTGRARQRCEVGPYPCALSHFPAPRLRTPQTPSRPMA